VDAPATGYLTSEPGRRRKWAERMDHLTGLKVGIVWAGNPGFALDRKRSVALELFRPILDVPGATFISLQKGPARAELSSAAYQEVIDWTDDINDYADTAALIDELDLVIGVDTSVIHLSGALGRPAWVISRISPHWTWQYGEGACPWYPTVRQFRQKAPCDWPEVIDRAAGALRALQRSKRS
jgi:hypothetical protein